MPRMRVRDDADGQPLILCLQLDGDLSCRIVPRQCPNDGRELCVSGVRLLAWVFPILAGQIVTLFGGLGRAALIMCSVYVIGLIVPWFMPETAGEPLPE
jgi:hypothetical protein